MQKENYDEENAPHQSKPKILSLDEFKAEEKIKELKQKYEKLELEYDNQTTMVLLYEEENKDFEEKLKKAEEEKTALLKKAEEEKTALLKKAEETMEDWMKQFEKENDDLKQQSEADKKEIQELRAKNEEMAKKI